MDRLNPDFSSELADDDMARSSSKETVRNDLVQGYIGKLKAVGIDKTKFIAVLSAFKSDPDVRPAEAIAIAWGYGGGGLKPKSKLAAIEKIEKRFNELTRKDGNIRVAKLAKPW